MDGNRLGNDDGLGFGDIYRLGFGSGRCSRCAGGDYFERFDGIQFDSFLDSRFYLKEIAQLGNCKGSCLGWGICARLGHGSMGRLVLNCGYRIGWCDNDRLGRGSGVRFLLDCVGEARLRAYGGGRLGVNYIGRRAYGRLGWGGLGDNDQPGSSEGGNQLGTGGEHRLRPGSSDRPGSGVSDRLRSPIGDLL